MEAATMVDLRSRVRGPVLEPNDPGYEVARRVYNAMIDKRPAVVVQCVDEADVVAAVVYARDKGLDLSIRGGSHSVPGFGTNDGGVVIDLSRMKGIRVDPTARRAWIQGGATWGDVDHATHLHGLHAAGGIISTTGVAGLTLGGGIGYLSRAHGLSLDNLRSADIVTADGRILHANSKSHPDLFWALRGGSGNFGVVSNFEFDLHPVSNIYGGPMFFELEHGRALMERYRSYVADAPLELGFFFAYQITPPLPFIPDNRRGEPLCLVVACFNGNEDDGKRALAPIVDVAAPVAQHVGMMPFSALNSAFDALLPPGLQHYWKANFATELTDGAISAHLEHGPKLPALESTMHIYSINGACHRVPADATAFGHRDATFATVIAGMWPDPAANPANIAWVREYSAALAPHSKEGGYVNFAAADDQDRVASNYGANYRRLLEIKRKYDPGNVFHMNQNLRPDG